MRTPSLIQRFKIKEDKKNNMKRMLICPICNSTNIKLDAGGYTGKYNCKNCGYVGMVIEMTESEYKEMKEKLKTEEVSKLKKK
jgi:transposase-like protein